MGSTDVLERLRPRSPEQSPYSHVLVDFIKAQLGSEADALLAKEDLDATEEKRVNDSTFIRGFLKYVLPQAMVFDVAAGESVELQQLCLANGVASYVRIDPYAAPRNAGDERVRHEAQPADDFFATHTITASRVVVFCNGIDSAVLRGSTANPVGMEDVLARHIGDALPVGSMVLGVHADGIADALSRDARFQLVHETTAAHERVYAYRKTSDSGASQR